MVEVVELLAVGRFISALLLERNRVKIRGKLARHFRRDRADPREVDDAHQRVLRPRQPQQLVLLGNGGNAVRQRALVFHRAGRGGWKAGRVGGRLSKQEILFRGGAAAGCPAAAGSRRARAE